MPPARELPGLQTIFAIFLGLLLTAFVGVGVNTFFPSPAEPLEQQMQAIGREERRIENGRPADALTTVERDRLRQLRDSTELLNVEAGRRRTAWGQTTSLLLIAIATVVMAIAVWRADQLAVLSNGLLLGGVFTMVYGVGMILATTTSIARFVALSIALVVTLGLGYVRFTRRGAVVGGAVLDATAGGAASGDVTLVVRVAALEQRLNAVASALSRTE